MNKILLSMLFSASFLMGTSFAQTPPPAEVPAIPATVGTPRPMHHEHHPEITRAIRKLRGAKQDLEKAAHDYGGHKAQAIAAINQALAELHAALEVAK